MAQIPDSFMDVLTEKETYATLATMRRDGTPHLTSVWVDYDPDENRVLVNTERERQKEINVRRDPRVGLLAADPDEPYRWISVGGEVDDLTEDGAREHIDKQAMRYFGVEDYPNPIQTKRVLMKIRPDHVIPFDPK